MSNEAPPFVVDWGGEETEAERKHYRALYQDLAHLGMPFARWPCQQCGKEFPQEWPLILGHTADGKRIADSEWDEAERKGRLFYCSPACWDAFRSEGVEMDGEEVQERFQEWQEAPEARLSPEETARLLERWLADQRRRWHEKHDA